MKTGKRKVCNGDKEGSVSWSCSGEGIVPKALPAECQSAPGARRLFGAYLALTLAITWPLLGLVAHPLLQAIHPVLGRQVVAPLDLAGTLVEHGEVDLRRVLEGDHHDVRVVHLG